jgi:hypothetical protein
MFLFAFESCCVKVDIDLWNIGAIALIQTTAVH